jgi:hypothetical protein
MGTSKAQKLGVVVTCQCGCGEQFRAFPIYRNKSEGGGLRVPEYRRGHHPNCRKTQTGNVPVWNKGLQKGDHPSIERMGFQVGHKPYNDWSHVNRLLATNAEIKAKWIAAKIGQVAWNKGKTKAQYANGIAFGPKHGNWKGGFGSARDTADWKTLRLQIMRRDNYTCVECGDSNHVGRGSRIRLEVHHIVAICVDPDLAFDPNNLLTLCRKCHFKTHNFGNKAKK